MQIARKVLILLGASVFGTLLVTTTLELRSLSQQFRRENTELHTTILANLMQNLNGALFNFDESRLINQISAAFEFGSIKKIVVFDEQGKALVAFQASDDPQNPQQMSPESIHDLPALDFSKALMPYQKAALRMIRKSSESSNTLIATLWYLEGTEKTFVGHALLIFDESKADAALQKEIGNKLASALALAIVIFGLSFLLIRSLVIAKLLVLKSSALQIKKRNYSVTLPSGTGDEIAELADAFQEMIQELKAYQDKLEERVKDKTRDIRSILDTTPVGLFSFGKDLLIQSDYARHLESILEVRIIAGHSVDELLLKTSDLSHDDRERVLAALIYSMGQDDIVFEANAPNLPKELEVRVGTKRKSLDLDWSPMFNDKGLIDKILVSVRDITEHLRLKKDADLSRQNLQRLGEILTIGPDAYLRFKVDYEDILQSIHKITLESTLDITNDEIESVYVLLHTLKGYARFSQFHSIAEACHQAETALQSYKMNEKKLRQEIRIEILAIEESMALYETSFAPLQSLRNPQQKAFYPTEVKNTENHLSSLLRDMDDFADQLAKDLGKGGYIIRRELQGRDLVSGEFYKTFSRCLVHLLRNAIDHGLETIEERRAKGKEPKGVLRIYWKDDTLCLKDDGRGIDLERIREKATQMGRSIPQDQSSLVALVFEDGFSTAASTNQISGRGVGMGAVRKFLEEIDCKISIVPDRIAREGEKEYMEFHFEIKVPRHHENSQDLMHAV